MSIEENKDNEIPPFPKPSPEYVPPVKEEKKKSGGLGIVSLLISGYFIVNGIMRINEGMETWGFILIAVGLLGGIWKIYDMMK